MVPGMFGESRISQPFLINYQKCKSMKLIMAVIPLIFALVTTTACITPFSGSPSSGGIPAAVQDTPSISPAMMINNLSITPTVSTGHIEVLVQGGSDTNLTMLIIDIISPSGTKSTLTVNVPTQGEAKLTSAASGRQHIVVTGQFSDGSQQLVYDNYVDVPG
jgi:hypothetical protein